MLGRFSSAAVCPLNPAERGDGTGGNIRAHTARELDNGESEEEWW